MEQNLFEFVKAVKSVSRKLSVIEKLEAKRMGLLHNEYMLMLYIKESEEELNATELSQLMCIDKGALSRIIKKLEEENYVKVKTKNNKRYGAPVVLKAKGTRAVEKLEARMNEIVGLDELGVSDRTKSQLYKVLGQVSANLDNYEE